MYAKLCAFGRTIELGWVKDDDQPSDPTAMPPDTAPTPTTIYVEPLGFRRLDDPLPPERPE